MKRIGLTRLAENFPWPLALSALGLLAVGLINLYSTSGVSWGDPAANHFFKQLGFAVAGSLGFFAFFFFDYRNLKALAWPLFFVSLALLLAVKLFGVTAGGATRWLPLGPFRFQPSELAKVAAVLLLAHILARRPAGQSLGFKDFLLPIPILLAPFFLILKQPDLGTALHLLLTSTPLFILARLRPRVVLTVLSLAIAIGSWVFFLGGKEFLLRHEVIKPYHLARFRYYLSPEDSPNDQGWQIIQAKSAIGSGQVLGQGFQAGSQQKYGFLPAPETDFAFAALAEEWGFVGASFVLLLFFSLYWSSMGVVRHSGEAFGAFLALGLASLIFWQMTINVAMVIGLFPVVGIPLPFISYGGSSLFISILSVAIIANVGLNRHVFQEEAVKQNPEVWEKGAAKPRLAPADPVRRLAPPNPDEPEPYPDHRLPHRKPWLRHLRKPARPIFERDDFN